VKGGGGGCQITRECKSRGELCGFLDAKNFGSLEHNSQYLLLLLKKLCAIELAKKARAQSAYLQKSTLCVMKSLLQ
jgi:hypothetical protein